MVNDLMNGIVQMISQEFGAGYEIYTEVVEQGLTEPCFLVECIDQTYSHAFWQKYKEKVPICIHYFSAGPDRAEEFNIAFQRLAGCLEYVTVGERLIRGTGMRGEYEDGVYHFLVDYEMTLRVVTETDKMEGYGLETTEVKAE